MSGLAVTRATRVAPPAAISSVVDLLVPQLDSGDIWRSGAQDGLSPYLYDQTWTARIVAPEDGTLSIETSVDAVTWTTAISTATTVGVATVSAAGSDIYFRVVFVCGGLAQTGSSVVTLTIDLQP